MHTTTRSHTVLALALAATVLAGCGGIGDAIGDRVAEEAAEGIVEAGGGGDAEVDFNGEDGVSIETSEGSLSFGSQELPDDFPDLPIPDGAQVQVSSVSGDGSALVIAIVEGDGSDVAAQLRGELEADGHTITDESTTTVSTGRVDSFAFDGPAGQGRLTVTTDGEGTTFQYALTPEDTDG